ncbi:MAG TPA: diguanylate cyclase [Anaerolineales bacterium]|nr:diguanylate cyclase [Anaerolineales bacterium]
MINSTEDNLSHIQFAALEAAANGIVITDTRGIIIWVNPAMKTLTGYSAEELVGQSTNMMKSGKHSKAFYQNLWQTINAGKVWRGDIINCRKDGSLYYEDMTITPVFDTDGKIQNYIAIKQDITRYRQAVVALSESEERFRQLINAVNAHFYVAEYHPGQGFINTYISENIETLTGFPRQRFLNDFTFWQSLVYSDDQKSTSENTQRIQNGESIDQEYRIVDAVGIVKWVRDDVHVIAEDAGNLHLYGTITDITARKENENRIRHLATHDPLTNLPNRIMFQEILEHAITYAKRNNLRVAVFFLDIDNFKTVNDTYGHHIGDTLLKSIAERLTHNLREHDTISRISGDEFTIVTEQLKSARSAPNLAKKIHTLLEGKYQLLEHTIDVSVSVGGSIYPDHAEDFETLIRMADAAMYKAKNSTDLHYVIYQPGDDI